MAVASPPATGVQAPDAVVYDTSGREVHLNSIWPQAERATIFTFLRHFG